MPPYRFDSSKAQSKVGINPDHRCDSKINWSSLLRWEAKNARFP
jgi:hypothetical protein